MLNVRTMFSIALLILALALSMSAATAQSGAPAGKVSIETTSIAAGIGLSWGDGRLKFNGREYRFSVDGVTFVDFGVSKSSATGEVYNLTHVAKFEGNYVAAEASITLGGGMGGVALRNSNGVIMHLTSVSQGARLQLGSSGINVKLW
ncbi:MAG TPA: EipA family protein [Candidatus Binatia bacterium]